MTIKQLGGVFGRNPTFNDVTIEGELTFNGDIDIGSDLKINGDLEVTGTGKIDDLIVGATSAPQAGVNLEVKSATSELRLSTSDGSITNGETIGKITWNAPDEGSGLNANIVAGEISLVSDGNWDSTRYTPSNIVFKTTPVNGPTMVEAARFTSTGNLAFPSGQGIDFSATAGTGTSELFDDYEEGTYTADFYEDGGSTLDTVTGYYTKIGNVVTIHVESIGGTTGGSGAVRSNLPFTSAHPASNTLAYSASNGNIVSCFVLSTGTYLEFVDTVGAIGSSNKMIGSDVWSGSRTYFSLTYITSD